MRQSALISFLMSSHSHHETMLSLFKGTKRIRLSVVGQVLSPVMSSKKNEGQVITTVNLQLSVCHSAGLKTAHILSWNLPQDYFNELSV